ncbi:MAG: GGDEF domain-containing protein [Leptolyngbyaceae cyanobacterium SU_3_3]|nr:GGDEF domain-containing protein [Leptolyngbyaceae cyanobacterium SU_3_3]NJR48374.1 GGDEF domain-containing protein [Leptolyngbyaceae cyanobacterium CSU_1_3]
MNQFGNINHHYGHDAGDAVLRQFGQRLRQAFQSEDLVSRWGGEEFAIGMYGMTQEEGVQRLNAVLDLLQQEPFTISDPGSLSVTFCAEVAQYPEDGLEVRSLYLAAAAALDQAKQAGSSPIRLAQPQKSLSIYAS